MNFTKVIGLGAQGILISSVFRDSVNLIIRHIRRVRFKDCVLSRGPNVFKTSLNVSKFVPQFHIFLNSGKRKYI